MTLKTHKLTYQLKEKKLIDQISLSFEPGFVYGILGPNGSGKSTLLKTMTGIWQPTAGSLEWNGEPLLQKTRIEISRTLSLVPQNPPLHFDFSVEDIVKMGRYSHGRQIPKRDEALIQSILKKVDAWHLRKQFLSQLSGGERQRVYIARALVTEAPVLLLDEPTSYLDVRHQLEIWKLLRILAEQGKTVIVAVHDLLAANRFCDYLSILYQGKCVATGSYNTVINSTLLHSIFGIQLTNQKGFSYDLSQ